MEKKNNELEEVKTLDNLNLIGTEIKFGYDPKSESPLSWKIIALDHDKVLLWSNFIIKDMPYSNDLKKEDYNLYYNSLIRNYLNKDFMKYFSSSELSQIESNGKDKVYILSIDDLNRYMSIEYQKENSNLRARPTPLLFSNDFETNESGYGKYWLKNNDSKHDYASIVDSFGNITRAKINNPNIGVRPAIWIHLDKRFKLIEE
ncbi:MAG: DUF6273 domain-containing protein [Acholeplasmatales bacterium]|nr:DUF6273 domain-containing protein [Acholeplasmatales bacterium]